MCWIGTDDGTIQSGPRLDSANYDSSDSDEASDDSTSEAHPLRNPLPVSQRDLYPLPLPQRNLEPWKHAGKFEDPGIGAGWTLNVEEGSALLSAAVQRSTGSAVERPPGHQSILPV